MNTKFFPIFFLFFSLAVQAQNSPAIDCDLSTKTCDDCPSWSFLPHRAAADVSSSSMCVPCMNLCGGSVVSLKSEVEVSDLESAFLSLEDQLIVAFDNELIEGVALINPEAGAGLLAIRELSLRPKIMLPSKGNIRSGILKTTADVLSLIETGTMASGEVAGSSNGNIHVDGNPDVISLLAYSLDQDMDGYFLTLKHRILNSSGDVVDRKYQDIRVYVNKITNTGVFYEGYRWESF